MPVKTKISSMLAVLVTMVLIAAQCGAEPGQAVQSSQQIEPLTQEPATSKEEPHNKEEPEHDEAGELSPVKLADGEKLKVLATTNIVGDLTRNVGGDMIELTTILPIGADPHTFSPTPQDAAAVADAHVIFVNGLHLEEFLTELIENAGGEAPTVAVSANVETREFEEREDLAQGHGEGERDEDEHAHEAADPHIWLTPTNAVVMVHNIEHALSELDPANAASYEANAAAYTAQLEELDAWVTAQIEIIPAQNRALVTDHEAFGYYADRYGLDVVGAVIPAYSTNAEPSARELAALQQAISDFEVKAVFVGATVNPVLAARLAEDTGIELIPLYTGSLGEAGSGVETYLALIRYNTTAIVAALK
jgi:ABC-type Zn uptake system ZnuABC Zn-binding protein ZnuA